MKEVIIIKSTEMFLKLGFKSVTMDDIAHEMGISKKTIYKYFHNKEVLIEGATEMIHQKIYTIIDGIIVKNYNAIEENFKIRMMFKEMFQNIDNSPVYQLKKHYPKIYQKMIANEFENCNNLFKQNIIKGKNENLYRKDLDSEIYAKFYYFLIFSIKESTATEIESAKLENLALEYNIRAMATPEGIIELEKQLSNTNN